MLNLGTNFLKVDVKINNVIKQKILSLKNVKDNNDLFFQEILTAFVKPKLVIDGKTLFVNDTYRDALQLIKNHIEKALPIAKISLEDVNQSFQQIKANRVQVRVVIRIANISQVAIFNIKNIVVRSQHSAWDNFVALNAKNYSSDNYFLSQLFKQEENQDLINVNTVKEELDGSLIYGEGLTSANTIADAFNQWVDEFDALYDEVKFSLDPSVDGTEKLQEDENTFVIKISSGKEWATIVGGVTGVELLDEDRLNNFEKHLENPIDGSALNTGQTHSDALDFLIDKLSNFDNFVEITLTNLSVDGSKKLTVNSKINITIKSNDVKRSKEVIINNIKLSHHDRLSIVSTQLKETIIDGASLNSNQTYNDALQLIANKVKTLDIGATVTLVKESLNTKLVGNENLIKVIVTIGDQYETIEVKVNNVTLSDEDRIQKIIKEVLNNPIDGSSLNTDNNMAKALTLVATKIKAIDKDIKVSLAKPENGTTKLIENNNLFNVILQLNKIKETIGISINDVKLSASDRLKALKIELQNKVIDGNILTTDNTVHDAFDKLIKPEIERIVKQATITLVDNGKVKLNSNENLIKVKVELEGKTEEISFKVVAVNLSNKDRVENLVTKIKDKKFDGSSFDTTKTNKDLLEFIKLEIALLDDKISVVLKDPNIIANKIVSPENRLVLLVKLGEVTREVAIKVDNVKLSSADRLENIFNKFNNKEIDGSSLTSDNTFTETLPLISDEIKAEDKDITIKLVENGALDINENIIKYILQIGNETKEISFKIINVKLSNEEVINNLEQWLLEKEFDGIGLTTSNHISDALPKIITEIQKQYPVATISLDDIEDAKEKLTDDYSIIRIKVNVGDLTVDIPVKIINIELSDVDRLEKIKLIYGR
ncbi:MULTISPECIES: hypothetical protein [unclassified Spiroplasma]|uniref:hypothetical protein n=1 Tax=unclassified Spiroplasma TaxID=2637901 RepID=UPI00313C42F6